jgi:hypothetical protein
MIGSKNKMIRNEEGLRNGHCGEIDYSGSDRGSRKKDIVSILASSEVVCV